MIPLHLQLSSILISLLLIGVIVRAVRHQWIQLKYSLLWLSIGLGTLLLSLFPQLAVGVAHILGVDLPVNALFFLALVMVLLLEFQLMVMVSQMEEKQRTLAQKLAILELELEKAKAPPPSPP